MCIVKMVKHFQFMENIAMTSIIVIVMCLITAIVITFEIQFTSLDVFLMGIVFIIIIKIVFPISNTTIFR